MNENQIVHKALEQLEAQTGSQGKWKPVTKELDRELDLYTSPNNLHLFAEVKRELRQHHLPHTFEMAEKYRPLDTAGNIYTHTDNNFIWIDGNKPVEQNQKVTNRAFTKTGLKTVFYLPFNKDAIHMPHRKLAAATAVAPGNIKNVIEGLG